MSAEPGYFVASDGASEQVPCPRGKHASGASNSECSSCETGKFAGETGQADCALAEAGYYVAEEGAAEQIPYNLKEILVDYTAATDPIYGDPSVCAPPVIQHVDDELRNDHGHCGRDFREQVLCDVKLVKP